MTESVMWETVRVAMSLGEDDDNGGRIYGVVYSVGQGHDDCEWFETEAERDAFLKEWKHLEVIE